MVEPLDRFVARAAEAVRVPDPDLFAAGVTDRLRAQPATARGSAPLRSRDWLRPGLLAAGVIAVIILVSTLVAPVRSAVAGLLGVDGVRITRARSTITVPPRVTPSSPSTSAGPVDALSALHLGEPSTLQQAARLVGFPMRVPTAAGYAHPDVVYVGTPPPGGMASMVYLPTDGRPAVAGAGVAALLSEFRGHLEAGFFQKLIGSGTTVEAVQVGAAAGYWLSGAPHEFFYVAADGTVDTETIRLAGNTLLWSVGGITYRLESGLSRDSAIAVAASMR
jgi:hypothetical protein